MELVEIGSINGLLPNKFSALLEPTADLNVKASRDILVI